jgi:uncharacterized protein with NRDE domain
LPPIQRIRCDFQKYIADNTGFRGDREENLTNITDQRRKIHYEIQEERRQINEHLDKLEKQVIENLDAEEAKIKSEIINLLEKLNKKASSAVPDLYHGLAHSLLVV